MLGILAFKKKTINLGHEQDEFLPGLNLSLYKRFQLRNFSNFLNQDWDENGEPKRDLVAEAIVESELEKENLKHAQILIGDSHRSRNNHFINTEMSQIPQGKIIPLATTNPIHEKHLKQEEKKSFSLNSINIPKINFRAVLALFKSKPQIPIVDLFQNWKWDIINQNQFSTHIGKHRIHIHWDDKEHCPNCWIVSCKSLQIHFQPLGTNIKSLSDAKIAALKFIRQRMMDKYVID